jgi:hypothetical protein
MQRYKNLNGSSNILNFEIRLPSIVIEFDTENYRFYEYSYHRPGQYEVERMKELALRGYGLNEYISESIKGKYDNKW